jgi:hypothetical protein
VIEVSSVRVAETVIQALCLIGPMAAGWLALRTILQASSRPGSASGPLPPT